MKWQTLRHNGVAFPPPYDYRGLVVRIKNEKVKLTPEQEETVKEALRLASLSAKASEDGAENTKNLLRSADKNNNKESYEKQNQNTEKQGKPPAG